MKFLHRYVYKIGFIKRFAEIVVAKVLLFDAPK